MTIDWVTVSAQVVNFLILVWLLKRFLYRPVLRAMDRREQGIRQRLEEADEREAEAEARLEDYRDRQADLERRRDALLRQAEEEAARSKQRWLEDARVEVAQRRQEWQRQLDEERQALLQRLGQRSLAALEALARQTLQDLAGTRLEARAIEVFIERLAELDAESRRRLGRGEGPLQVATAFDLSPEEQARLEQALQEQLGPSLEVHFARSTSLICGLELVRDGCRLGWSLADHLDALHERLERDWHPARSDREAG